MNSEKELMQRKVENMWHILEEEYDIHSVEELQKTIEESPKLDLSIFRDPLL